VVGGVFLLEIYVLMGVSKPSYNTLVVHLERAVLLRLRFLRSDPTSDHHVALCRH
jgi:hypothetical protein